MLDSRKNLDKLVEDCLFDKPGLFNIIQIFVSNYSKLKNSLEKEMLDDCYRIYITKRCRSEREYSLLVQYYDCRKNTDIIV